MSASLVPELSEAESSEDLGFFFKRLGDLCFSPAAAQAYPSPAASVAVAARAGAVFFSDADGVYACRIADLVPHLAKGNSDEELPPLDASQVAAAVLPVPGGARLALSSDSSLLAVFSGGTVTVFSTQQLMAGGTAALAERHFAGEVLQLAWRSGADRAQFAALDAAGGLHLQSLGRAASGASLPAFPSPPKCLAWSPDGSRLAVGAGGQVHVLAPTSGGASWQQAAAVQVQSLEVQEEGQQLEVDSLSWVAPSAILVSSKLSAADGAEEPIAPQCMLSWPGGQADPSGGGAELSEFFASNILEGAAAQGPWLLATTVAEWGATVYAHRKASDDHIKLAALVSGRPVAAEVTDDRLAIRIPNAPDGEDNFVVGLGVDLTCTSVEVAHPTDPNAPDLPPQPVLLVATSDGVLRFYTFGRLDSSAGGAAPCIVAAPQALPAPPPIAAGTDAAAAGAPAPSAAGGAEARAAGTALPDEESEFEEEEEEEAAAPAVPAAEARAAAVALPESDVEDEEGEEVETPKGSAPAPSAAAPAKQLPVAKPAGGEATSRPLFPFASSAASATSTTSLFGASAVASAPFNFGSAPAFGFGSSAAGAAAASAPGISFGSSAASSGPAAASAPAFGAASAPAASAPAFGFGAPASGAFGFGGPAAGASSSGFSFGGASSGSLFGAAASAASAFGFGQPASSAAAAAPAAPPPAAKPKAAASQPPMPSLAAAAESQKLLAKLPPAAAPSKPKAAASQPPMPSLAAAAESQKLLAKVQPPAGAAVPPAARPPAPPQAVQQPAPPPKTAVDAPQPKLAGEAREAAAMEADFLRSLHQTRQLEAEAHDALAALFKGVEGPHTAASFKQLQQRTRQVQERASAVSAKLDQQRQQLAELSSAAKDALRKCDAMPAFKHGAAAAAGDAQQLLRKQPLEPALAALRDDIRWQLQQLRLTADDLQECLMALEERQRQLRAGDVPPQRLTTQHIYNAVNAQMGIIQAQASRLAELTARLEARGLLEDVDLDLDLEGPEEDGELPVNRQLTRLVLTPSSATPRGRQRSPAPYDNTGQHRSPWQLVADSPASQRQAGTPGSSRHTPQSQPRRSPLGAASPAPGAAAGSRWQRLQIQLLQRCQGEGGGVRITTAKKAAPATPPAKAAPPALPPPSPVPELPAYSLADAARPPVPPAASPAPLAKPPAAGSPFGGGQQGLSFASFGAAPGAAAARGAAPAEPFFIPSASFTGAKPGYVFKMDGSGLGFYRDQQLPTAGSLFGKPAAAPPAAKPKALASQPPMPSLAAAAESQKLLAKLPPAAAPAKPKAAASQPPMPSLAAAAESQKLLAKVQPLAPKPAASQPPMPSLAAAAESQKLLAKVGAAAGAAQAQPPMPTAAAAQAAQARFEAFLSSSSAAATASSSGAAAAPPAPAVPAPAASAPAFGFGAAPSGGSPFGAPAASSAPAASTAAAASSAAGGADALSFGAFGFGAASSAAATGAAASPFGKGLGFGAASSAAASPSSPFGAFGVTASSAAAAPAAASTPSFGFGAPAAASSPASPFGAASSAAAPTSLFGASSAAAAPGSVFGAAASSAAASPFGAFGAAPAASSAAASPFGAFGAAASSAAAGSVFGQPATPAAPFGTPAKPSGGLFGSPATPGFGQQATGFGAAASQSAFGQPGGFGAAASQAAFGQASGCGGAAATGQAGFGQPSGFGAAASQAAFGQASGFGAAASQAAFGQASGFGAAASQSAFGQPSGFGAAASQPAFGQPSGFGAAASQSAFGQPSGFGAAAQQGGGFGAFGQQQQQQPAGGGFGTFGQAAGGGFGGFGGTSPVSAPKPAGGAMWQPRK